MGGEHPCIGDYVCMCVCDYALHEWVCACGCGYVHMHARMHVHDCECAKNEDTHPSQPAKQAVRQAHTTERRQVGGKASGRAGDR